MRQGFSKCPDLPLPPRARLLKYPQIRGGYSNLKRMARQSSGGRTTIRDIAARAEVSAMTVSRVLRGQGSGASEETSRRILELAHEMNYIAVRPALQNTHLSTRVVGVVFDGADGVKSFVGAHTFEGLRDEAIRRDFDLLLHAGGSCAGAPGVSEGMLRREEAAFLDRRTDGVIFISPRERRALLEALVQHGFPVVSCFSSDVPPGVATVAPDNEGAMQQAVKYLHGRGHRRIAYFAGPDWHSDARERTSSWQAAMREHGLWACAEWIESSQGETARHVSAARRLLALQPTAVACHNDYRALLLDEAARARGLQLPGELSILGMDDLPEAGERGLSTLRLDFEAAGRAAIASVIAMIEGTGPQQASRRLQASLIERRSVAHAPGRD